MPFWTLVVLFAGILAALAVIITWEVRRVRNPPTLVAGALGRYLASDPPVAARGPVKPQGKVGFDD